MNAYDRGKGAMFVTACVFGALFAAMGVTAWNKDTQSFSNLIETVKALTMVAGGYWLGSSAGGQKKDDTIAAQGVMLSQSSPTIPLPARGADIPSPDPEVEALRHQ